MKLDHSQIQEIFNLHNKGLSSRKIAKALGIGKSSVNDNLAKYKPKDSKPRICFVDIETSYSTAAVFGRWNVNVGHDNIIEEGGQLISIAWKLLGDKEVQSLVMTPTEAVTRNDERLVAALYDIFEDSDFVCAHFGKGFDIPVFKTRLALHGFNNPKAVKVIDTKQIAARLKFPSNKLDSLADYFNLGRKKETGGITLWKRCMQGDEEALETMRVYNEQDVELLEGVYLQLRAFDTSAPNLGLYYNDDKVRCPACGSGKVETTGNTVTTSVSHYLELLCDDCGHRSRMKQVITSKDKRKSLLTTAR